MRERSLSVPIEYVASPAELALVGDKPAEVKLHLAGPKSDLDSMNPSQLSVKVDLSEAKPGKQTFVVAESDVKLPKRVRLLDAEPSSFELSLLEILQKEFVVKPQLVGKLPGSLKLVSIEVRPQKVRGFAPVAQGEEEDFTVMTTPVYLESIKENTRLFCKIIAPPSIQPTDKRWPDVEIVIRVDSNQQ